MFSTFVDSRLRVLDGLANSEATTDQATALKSCELLVYLGVIGSKAFFVEMGNILAAKFKLLYI